MNNFVEIEIEQKTKKCRITLKKAIADNGDAL